ncbi:MAG: hypothetical protein IJS17_00885, partial [Clostridia bacterium]|nr:hypothetical protein [Clostridia bacterium]
ILIGDKGKLDFEGEDEAGNSVVFLFTDKALDAFDKVKDSVDIIEVSKEKMASCSERLYSPAKPKMRAATEKFFEILRKEGIDKAADFALPVQTKRRKILSKMSGAGKRILKKMGV